MHPLRTSRHLLQLVQKSALPEVSGRSSRSLARSASPGASPDILRPCGLHTSSSFGSLGLAEQEGHLRSPVSHQCGNSSGGRARSSASRCRDRLLQRAAYLESKTRTSPACTLCGAGAWSRLLKEGSRFVGAIPPTTTTRNSCPSRLMSFSAVFCCIYSPKVSCASVTSASWPIADAPQPCLFAFSCSARYHKPNQS